MRKGIIILTRFCPPCGGGAELATYTIIKRFLTKLFDRVVVAAGSLCTECMRSLYSDVEVVRAPLFEGTKPLIIAKILRNRDKIMRMVREFDIVYIPSNALIPLAYLLRKWGYKGRIVLHLHDYQAISYTSALFYNQPPGPYTDYLVEKKDYGRGLRAYAVMALQPIQKLYNKGFCSADIAIMVSKRQSMLIEKYSRCRPNETKVIYNPLPDEILSQQSVRPDSKRMQRTKILYTGGPRLTKGYPVVLKLLMELARRQIKRKVEITFLQITNKKKYYIEILAKRTKLKVKLLPRLPRAELYRLYLTAPTILLHPSLHEEPLPYSIVEAVILYAKPLASRLGGVQELLGGTPLERYMHKPGNVKELINHLEEVLEQDYNIYIEEIEKTRNILIKKLSDSIVENNIREIFL